MFVGDMLQSDSSFYFRPCTIRGRRGRRKRSKNTSQTLMYWTDSDSTVIHIAQSYISYVPVSHLKLFIICGQDMGGW